MGQRGFRRRPNHESTTRAAIYELNTPQEQRNTTDTRSPEVKQLDTPHPPAKPNDYLIRYYTPGQEPPVIPKEVKEAEAMHRTWLAGAGFDRALGNSLVNAIGKVVDTTHKMSEKQLATPTPNMRSGSGPTGTI